MKSGVQCQPARFRQALTLRWQAGLVGSVRKHKSSWIRLLIGFLVGAICFWISLRSVDRYQMAAALESVSWPWISVAILGVIAVSASKALRWKWLYPSTAPPLSWFSHFVIILIAQMLNLLIPIRLGEIARIGLMAQERRAVGMTLGTIVVEKFLDLLAVGSLLLFAMPAIVLPSWIGPTMGKSAALTGIMAFIILSLSSRFRVHLLRRLSQLPRPGWPPLSRIWEVLIRSLTALLEGISAVTERQFLMALALTVLIWWLSISVIYMVLWSFGFRNIWSTAIVLCVALTFSNLAPTPPALVGVMGAVTEAVLVPFGFSPSYALVIGTALNIVLVAPPVGLGGWAAGARLLSPARHSVRRALGLTSVDPTDQP